MSPKNAVDSGVLRNLDGILEPFFTLIVARVRGALKLTQSPIVRKTCTRHPQSNLNAQSDHYSIFWLSMQSRRYWALIKFSESVWTPQHPLSAVSRLICTLY